MTIDVKDFQPLLAATVTDITKLRFPLIASPKLDGIRCVVIGGKALTRKLKPIPNHHIREAIEKLALKGVNLDGELMIPGCDFNGVQSAVMSFEGTPYFQYMVFDIITNKPYKERLDLIKENQYIYPLDYTYIQNLNFLIAVEETYVKKGYEGIMLRDPEGRYKFGRSTEREQILLKLKRFYDTEATVVGFEERMTNNNEKLKDERGYAKRSSAKSGLAPAGMLGSLLVKDAKGLSFGIGSGFTDAQRKDIWNNQSKYLGRLVTYKFQELSKYGIPRFPVFKTFRGDL